MSEEVKRYSYVDLPFSTASGHYVLYSDYAELEREVKELREDKKCMDFLETMVVEVRVPLDWLEKAVNPGKFNCAAVGSRLLFIASPEHGEDEDRPSDIRKECRTALKEPKR